MLLSVARAEAVHAQAPLERAGATDLARSELLSRAAPGAVVALVHGDTVEVQAIGHVDPERTIPLTADNLFGTGELSLWITALIAVRLAEAGDVALDTPIRRWATELPPRIGALTLEQLLTQTSGLDDARDEPPRRPPGPTAWPGATDRALFTEPGRIHSPSRHGPALARSILEIAAGAPFETLAATHLFTPAGMSRSTYDPGRAEELGAVPGQVMSNSISSPLQALSPRASPLRQLYTTAGDLAALLAAGLPNDAELQGALARTAASAAVRPALPSDSVGMGVRIRAFGGRRMVVYEQGIGGYGTLVRWLPDAHVGIVILANSTGATLSRTADALLASALGPAASPAVTAPTQPDTPFAEPSSLAGTYANGDRIIVLELDGERLYWVDGELRLPVERNGAHLDVLVADGRVAESLRTYVDAVGDVYLIVGDLAYRKNRPSVR